jgi:hypothetical protein
MGQVNELFILITEHLRKKLGKEPTEKDVEKLWNEFVEENQTHAKQNEDLSFKNLN